MALSSQTDIHLVCLTYLPVEQMGLYNRVVSTLVWCGGGVLILHGLEITVTRLTGHIMHIAGYTGSLKGE